MSTPSVDIAERFATLERKCQRLKRLLLLAVAIGILTPIVIVKYGAYVGLTSRKVVAEELQVNRITFTDGQGDPFLMFREGGKCEGIEIVYHPDAKRFHSERVPPEIHPGKCAATTLQPYGVRVDRLGESGTVVCSSGIFGCRSESYGGGTDGDIGVFLFEYPYAQPPARFPHPEQFMRAWMSLDRGGGYRVNTVTTRP